MISWKLYSGVDFRKNLNNMFVRQAQRTKNLITALEYYESLFKRTEELR